MLTTPPAVASGLAGPSAQALADFARAAMPVRAACLGLALSRLPVPSARFALGIDAPLYFSVHSAVAKLAPAGGALIHAAKYLAPNDGVETAEGGVRAELEALVDGCLVRSGQMLPCDGGEFPSCGGTCPNGGRCQSFEALLGGIPVFAACLCVAPKGAQCEITAACDISLVPFSHCADPTKTCLATVVVDAEGKNVTCVEAHCGEVVPVPTPTPTLGEEKFREISFDTLSGKSGGPLIPKGSSAWFECQVVTRYDVSDYHLFVGKVVSQKNLNDPPLLWCKEGGFFTLKPL